MAARIELNKKLTAAVISALMLGGTVMLAGCDASQPGPSDGDKAAQTEQPKHGKDKKQKEESQENAGNSDNSNTGESDTGKEQVEAVVPTPTLDSVPTKDAITINETKENSAAGEHVITADGIQDSYSNIKVVKTGDSTQNDEADFYGDNSAIFATNKATLDLSQIVVESNGKHANAVFSYGEGTTVNISDSVIETAGDCSGGLMTTGGGTMNATNLNISTTGNSSAAIRSDRGGGDVNVVGGTYKTAGKGSPAIYSTADISVKDATLESTSSQGIVVEGKNSVSLENVTMKADNNSKNSDKSEWYQAVMIYQSMSGDASQGTAEFSMKGGSIDNVNGDIFFVNNTTANINLEGAKITNNDTDGNFLRAAAAGWGNEGSNGGHVDLTATDQEIDGNIIVDKVSGLNFILSGTSSYKGAINSDGAAGDVYVELGEGTKWTLTADSHITSLSCAAGSIDLAGHTLYVGDAAYTENTASTGTKVEHPAGSDSGQGGPGGEKPDGNGQDGSGNAPSGEKPDGAPEPPDGQAPDGNPPAKPGDDDGNSNSEGHKPPEKPSGDSNMEPPAKPDGNSNMEPPAKPDGDSAGNSNSERKTPPDGKHKRPGNGEKPPAKPGESSNQNSSSASA